MFVHPSFYPMVEFEIPATVGLPGGPYVKVRHGGTSHGASVVETTFDYLVGLGDDVILADSSGGPVTVSLPASASFLESRRYTIIKVAAAYHVIVNVVGGGTLNSAGDTSMTLTEQDRAVTFVCGGA